MAKQYVHAALAAARDLRIGRGSGAVHYFHAQWMDRGAIGESHRDDLTITAASPPSSVWPVGPVRHRSDTRPHFSSASGRIRLGRA
ncbi:hypothetical protein [Rhizobium tumorigenes]|uniref:Uncharacterized protein n=2 Tax=Rhizobium tumorigenes TaxID=2041385 RepID=A0AAF1KC30_9HYPH|nr:hypothetical protein [Rhizobium tumorigenes]WFR99200.1 hypothetical protein PR017_27810 [Rhizobium tumorigenes]